ncbi:MAG: Hsp20/alpha crystallin family protein [Deltaproteobacteria bacterium]|nr:Hsp20/alpha crystallin family protein [Deltaproteobacteria bacterium]
MNLVKYEPSSLFKVLDRLTEDFISPAEGPFGGHSFVPRVDIMDSEKELVIQVEVPGVDKTALNVETHNGVLTISGEKHQTHEEKGKGTYRSERIYGSFKRSFTLPDDVDPSKVTATQENGVLTISLPKRPEVAPKKITIA